MKFSTLCTAFAVVLAVGTPVLVVFMRENPFTKGMIPALAGEHGYSFEAIPSQVGKVSIVTGANTGLGYYTAKALAVAGSDTIMCCRSAARCDAARKKILEETKRTDLTLTTRICDLGDLLTIRIFVEEFQKHYSRLDTLVLNAGVMMPPFQLSSDGLESQFQVNHIGHYYLTRMLMPLLRLTASTHNTDVRIVPVSSNAHTFALGSLPKSVDEVNDVNAYNTVRRYGETKLANIVMTKFLNNAIKPEEQIYVNSVHPGMVFTEIIRHANVQTSVMFGDTVANLAQEFARSIAWDANTAALTQLYLATSPEVVEKNIRGTYFVPLAVPGTTVRADNDATMKEFMEFSDELLKTLGFNDYETL